MSISNNINVLGLFALTIGANYTSDLLGGAVSNQLLNNPLVKHTSAFLLLLCFLTLMKSPTANANEWVTPSLLLNAGVLYTVFLLLSKSEHTIALYVILLLIVIIFLQLELNNKTSDVQTTQTINSGINYATWLSGILIILGVIINYKKQKTLHKDNFNNFDFFLGTRHTISHS